MNFDVVAQYVLSAALLLFGGGAGVKYILERRSAKATGRVAEATVELQVDAAKLANLEHRFGLAQRAWDSERASLLARIGHLEEDLDEERAESAQKKTKIAELEQRLALVLDEVQSLTTELAQLRTQTAHGGG